MLHVALSLEDLAIISVVLCLAADPHDAITTLLMGCAAASAFYRRNTSRLEVSWRIAKIFPTITIISLFSPPPSSPTKMCLLQPRYACLECPPTSRCAAFVASDTDLRTNTAVPRLVPATSSEGPPPAVSGGVGTRRVASALRTLPHNQIASSSSGPSIHRGPRRNFPSASNPFSANSILRVAMFPLVIPGIHEPAGYGTRLLKAQNDHMLDILNRLDRHHLVFDMTVLRNGCTSPVEFTTHLVAALAEHGLSLPSHPQPLDNVQAVQLTKQPFALLSPTRRNNILTFKAHPTINANTFGIEEFTKLGKKFKNPDPAPAAADKILIFLAHPHGDTTSPAPNHLGSPTICSTIIQSVKFDATEHL
ncbi:hypothetical protein B0H17DRAFT_1202383 [Mycena rosella]|uniref:Uncharacterized protein n=1 Tax=Mycena rosella TaxID=1033263 RepID=A0AAD7DDT6_MYCRO|nr:hypothetical protein B0H17DRAFT_1202383 [Mycena rosella]